MHSVGLGGERDVDAVVDDQVRTGGGRQLAQAARDRDQLAARALLQAQLEQAGAAGEHRARQLDRVTAGVERIDDEVDARREDHLLPRGTAMPSEVIFFRRVLRLMPRRSAARS